MYLAHFGLTDFPFSITPKNAPFFDSQSSLEALNTLLVAVSMGEGFMKITGEVGTGKTTLCHRLFALQDDAHEVACVFNPCLEPLALFIERNPTIVMLALGFLLMIGGMLIAEGFGAHVPKGYIYAAMAFSLAVVALNLRARAKRRALAARQGA